ncbi:hypothetical protein SAMN04488541_101481 [Thermoflexibacter ruber]|uniref:Uncharacterized protein n=1 Tax=Thermoflexibacter ruber TaxID=1003 RepID=A0A1I2FNU9_9BACT|nr:hypothetical protein SAMN04488541_101481 [Thermoflexibacter ruber]
MSKANTIKLKNSNLNEVLIISLLAIIIIVCFATKTQSKYKMLQRKDIFIVF